MLKTFVVGTSEGEYIAMRSSCTFAKEEHATLHHIGSVHAALFAREVAKLCDESHHIGVVVLGLVEDKVSRSMDRLQRTLDAGVLVLLVAGIADDR